MLSKKRSTSTTASAKYDREDPVITIECYPGKSVFLASILLFLYGICITAVLNTPLSLLINSWFAIIIKLMILSIIIYSFYYNWRKLIFRQDKKSIIYVWYSEGKWGIKNKAGHCALGTLQGDSYKSPWFIILHIRFCTGSKRIIIPYDALKSAEYRALMLYMSY